MATSAPQVPAFLARGINADCIGININRFANFPYTDGDMAVWKTLGFTCARLNIEAHRLKALPAYPGEQASTEATVAADLVYIDAKIAQFVAAGFAVVPVLFIDKDMSQALAGPARNALAIECVTIMAARWCHLYGPDKLAINVLNEPYFDDSVPGLMYTDWSNLAHTGLMDELVAAVRRVSNAHWIVVDTVRYAKLEYMAHQVPCLDPLTVHSAHIYQHPDLTGQGVVTAPVDALYCYPRDDPSNPMPMTGKGQQFRTLKSSGKRQDYWWIEITRGQLDAYVAGVVAWAAGGNVSGVPVALIVGEFGCSAAAPLESRKRWMTDLLASLNKYDLARTVWSQYGRLFGIHPHAGALNANHRLDTDPASPTFGYDLDFIEIWMAANAR